MFIFCLKFLTIFINLAVLGHSCGTRGLRWVLWDLSLQHRGTLVAACGWAAEYEGSVVVVGLVASWHVGS